MAWRKRLVRSLVLLIILSSGGALWVYRHWTNPESIRLQVLAKLGLYLPGANVTLDSAALRLLGGISLTELHMARRDDPDSESSCAHHNRSFEELPADRFHVNTSVSSITLPAVPRARS